jgi:hypothetical protein
MVKHGPSIWCIHQYKVWENPALAATPWLSGLAGRDAGIADPGMERRKLPITPRADGLPSAGECQGENRDRRADFHNQRRVSMLVASNSVVRWAGWRRWYSGSG